MKKKLITIILGAGLALMAQARQTTTVYDFTTYNDGPLNGQNGWVGSTHYITNGALQMTDTNAWNSTRQSGSFDTVNTVDEFTVSVDWSFSETESNLFSNAQFFNYLFTDDTSSAGPVSFRPAIQKHNEGGFLGNYAVRLFTPTGANSDSYQVFPHDRMGLDFGAGDLDSDMLRMTFSARRGTNELDWTYVLSLDNLDTGQNCVNSAGTAASDTVFFTTNQWWVFISNAQLSTSHATDVKLYNMKVTETTSDTIVQWGEMQADGSGANKGRGSFDIVSSDQAWTSQFGSYNVGTNHNPAVGSSYYFDNTGRSPIFNGAVTASGASGATVADGSTTGDFLNTGANTTNYEAMVTWETFLEPNDILTGLEMRIKAGSVSNAQARFVIRKDGSWYASEAYNPVSDHFAFARSMVIAPDPSALTWYDFTPITGGTGVVSSVAVLSDFEGVDIVGYYGVLDDGEDATWCNIQCSYFRALADTGTTPWQDFVLLYDLGTEDKTAHSDADGLNNWGEYVFDGDPTDPADVGTQPTLDSDGVYHFSLIGDSTVTGRVVVSDSLMPISWTTNDVVVAPDTGTLDPYTSNIGTVTDEKFIQLWID